MDYYNEIKNELIEAVKHYGGGILKEYSIKIKSKEYERLPLDTKNGFFNNKTKTDSDFIKNPIIIKNV